MKTTRRTFLAATAAIPAASVLPAQVLAEAAPLPVKPPYPWLWWVSTDSGETYFEECSTIQDAIKVAKEYGGGLVAECRRKDYSLSLDGNDVLETLYGHNEEEIGEGEFIECTDEQERDLGRMVTDAIEAWAQKHKIDVTAWTFGEIRNRTNVEPVPGTNEFVVVDQ